VNSRDQCLREIESVYRSRFQYFVKVARAVTGDRERAVEAVQEAFVNAVRARASFRGDGPLEAWLWRAVVNAGRQAARKPLIETGREENEAYDPPPLVGELAPLVSQLPERQRLIVFLRYYADLDYRTIALALEIEVGTVSSSLAAAHAAIRKSMREVWSDA
jgi:RNA polymerase sigma-70 factor (ECF subfamily)